MSLMAGHNTTLKDIKRRQLKNKRQEKRKTLEDIKRQEKRKTLVDSNRH